nr:FCD domain-containing protein [Leucobacter weissii]
MGQYVSAYPLEQILVYRRALEIEAAQQAAVNRTGEQLDALRASYAYDRRAEPDSPPTTARGQIPGSFHHLVFEAAGNQLMSSMYAGVMGAIRVARAAGTVVYGATHDLRHLDHGAILAAIEAGDVAGAAHAMALHVDRDLVPESGIALPLDETDPGEAVPGPPAETPTVRAGLLHGAGLDPAL